MRNLIIILILIASAELSACECTGRLGNNFMNRLRNFDAIVMGTIVIEPTSKDVRLIVEQAYRGDITQDSIKLEIFSFCDLAPDALGHSTSWVLGLKSHGTTYSIPGCMHSFLEVVDERTTGTITFMASLFRFRNNMRLNKLERKIARRK